MSSVVELLRRAFERDSARPFVTWYGDGDARVELSVATLERWVAKTSNFLQDGLGVEVGERAAVALPTHWLTPAVWWGCWQNGLVVTPVDPAGELPVDADLLFVTPDRAAEAAGTARDVIAVSTAPLGGPVAAELAGGVEDFGAAVPGYDDRFSPFEPVEPRLTALAVDGRDISSHDLAAAAAERWDFPAAGRVLSAAPLHHLDGVLVVLAALRAGGGVVWGADERRAADEHVTVTLGAPMRDLPRLDG